MGMALREANAGWFFSLIKEGKICLEIPGGRQSDSFRTGMPGPIIVTWFISQI